MAALSERASGDPQAEQHVAEPAMLLCRDRRSNVAGADMLSNGQDECQRIRRRRWRTFSNEVEAMQSASSLCGLRVCSAVMLVRGLQRWMETHSKSMERLGLLCGLLC